MGWTAPTTRGKPWQATGSGARARPSGATGVLAPTAYQPGNTLLPRGQNNWGRGPSWGGPVAGARPGPGVGGAAGAAGTAGQNIQANPFLAETFGYFRDLWNKAGDLSNETYNKEPAIQDYQRTRAQGLKEIQANAGRQGFGPGTGLNVSQMGGYGRDTEQGAQALAGNLWNAGLDQRTRLLDNMSQILGGMGGVGASTAANQAQLAGLGQQASRDAVDAWYKTNMLPIEMEKARNQIQIANITAATQLAGML